MLVLVTCLLSPPLNHGLSIPLQTNSPWFWHNFPHKQYQNCCGCSVQELTPKSTHNLSANIQAPKVCDASEHQTRVPWMGWPSLCWSHTKKSCRPMKKAPQRGCHAKEHLTLPLPAASRHWKIQLFSLQFPLRNPEQHSALLKANNQGEFHLFLLDWDCWTKKLCTDAYPPIWFLILTE